MPLFCYRNVGFFLLVSIDTKIEQKESIKKHNSETPLIDMEGEFVSVLWPSTGNARATTHSTIPNWDD
jgi:hypothetical protein